MSRIEVYVERVRPGDEKDVLSLIRKQIYEEKSFKRLKQWMPDSIPPVTQTFVARVDREIVGAIVYHLRDQYDEQVMVDIFFIAPINHLIRLI